MTEEQIKELLKALHNARREAQKMQEAVRAIEEEMRKHYAWLYERRDETRKALEDAERAVREAVLAYNKETGERVVLGRAAWVEERAVIDGYTQQDAVQWAVEHAMPNLLKLDKRAYEKALKVGALPQDAPGEVRKEPSVRIKSDLSTVVEDKEGEE